MEIAKDADANAEATLVPLPPLLVTDGNINVVVDVITYSPLKIS